MRYEAAHEVVVVVVSEQGEALIGDGDRVTVGTGGRAVAGERKMPKIDTLDALDDEMTSILSKL